MTVLLTPTLEEALYYAVKEHIGEAWADSEIHFTEAELKHRAERVCEEILELNDEELEEELNYYGVDFIYEK